LHHSPLAGLAGDGAGRFTGAITLESPSDFQAFQRQTKTRGTVLVAGRALGTCDRAEARFTGNSLFGELPAGWQALTFDRASGTFHGDLQIASGGWYRFKVRLLESGKAVASL
jgi:hypothetical protein